MFKKGSKLNDFEQAYFKLANAGSNTGVLFEACNLFLKAQWKACQKLQPPTVQVAMLHASIFKTIIAEMIHSNSIDDITARRILSGVKREISFEKIKEDIKKEEDKNTLI